MGTLFNPSYRPTARQQAGMFAARKRNRLMTATVNSTVAPAWGTIVFSGNPTNGQTITINGTLITLGTTVAIGATLADTLTAIASYVAAHPISGVGSVSESGSGLLVLSAGPADTSVTLAASNATVSHATLQAQPVRARQALQNVSTLP